MKRWAEQKSRNLIIVVVFFVVLLLGATAITAVQQVFKQGSFSLYTFNTTAAPGDLEAISLQTGAEGGGKIRFAMKQKTPGTLQALRFAVGVWDSAGNLKGKALRDGEVEALGSAVSLDFDGLDIDSLDTMIVAPLSSACGDVQWFAARADFPASNSAGMTPAYADDFIDDQIRLLQECGPGFCTAARISCRDDCGRAYKKFSCNGQQCEFTCECYPP